MKTFIWLCAGFGLGVAAYLILRDQTPSFATGYSGVEDIAHAVADWGSRERTAGAGSDLLGHVKEGIGHLTADPQLADEGVVDQVAGAVQKTAGTVAGAAGQTLHDLNR